ncbi:Rrf2 family transcriptional regulator [Shewanella sp. NIFS-20-20]|uniref:Rrf2 family transcriptional regulator n=1 Tax=Shewanella sp. NIFS-20-20 TaxID=2853806 RepID=UPI001C4460F8|nr:Rrf2 family transcriptional regulator [Shewanella sp. NIFS-20-20]MBV7317494.1 Rrf2 family transcriptional regulator [Shewanella sp. NIFS-20-20]
MQLTRYTDYALRTLMYLAIQPNRDELFRIAEITQVFDLSPNHVSKIIHNLGKLGYLQTIRGKNGGFKLAKSPDAINIGKLVRELEPTMTLIDCHQPVCQLVNGCKLKGILAQAVVAFLAVLDQYSLQDMVVNRDQLVQLLPSLA